MNDLMNKLDIRLHDFQEDRSCLADVSLPGGDIQILNFIVKPGSGDSVLVHMPGWMRNRWDYSQLTWAETRRQIIECYLASPEDVPVPPQKEISADPVEAFLKGFYSFDPEVQQIPEGLAEPHFRFHSRKPFRECTVDVTWKPTGQYIRGIYLFSIGDSGTFCRLPRYTNGVWPYAQISWSYLQSRLRELCGGYLLFDLPISPDDELDIIPERVKEYTIFQADAALPGKPAVICGFELRERRNGSLRISTSREIGLWVDPDLRWNRLQGLITRAYLATKTPEPAPAPTPAESTPDSPPEVPAQEAASRRKPNKTVRVRCAKSSAFRFVPQTVLRLNSILMEQKVSEQEEDEGDTRPARPEENLVTAMNKGHIGLLEISMLSWIEQLHYATTTMLMDLIQSGHISRGGYRWISEKKFRAIVDKMEQLDLVSSTRFMVVEESEDDGGELVQTYTARDNKLIFALGKSGNRLLRQLDKSKGWYNPFDILRDGNTVKRYLSANQWLLYWLSNFPGVIGDNYETNGVVYRRGAGLMGARVFASVTCGDTVLVGEPLRRVEDFEQASHRKWLRTKFARFLDLFSHLDELYTQSDELFYPSRPVLTYICEDEEHIREVWTEISDLVQAAPEQEVWFTCDLRVFNDDMRGQRFLKMENGAPVVIDLKARLALEEAAPEHAGTEAEAEEM